MRAVVRTRQIWGLTKSTSRANSKKEDPKDFHSTFLVWWGKNFDTAQHGALKCRNNPEEDPGEAGGRYY